jgi:hypothetical protein
MERSRLTNLVQHLVAFVKNEHADVPQPKLLVADESIQTSGSGHDDMRMGIFVRENLVILRNGGTTVEDGSLDLRHVPAEARILVLDLVSELSSVAHHQHRGLAVDGLDLLKTGQDEDGRLAQSGFRLADDIGAENRLRDANLLDCSESW